MTKSQLKQIIKECIKEIRETNESFGTYQGQSTQGQSASLRSLYNKIKSDPIVRKNKINVHIQDDEDTDPAYRSIDLTHNTFDDFSVLITSVGKDKYQVDIPVYGANQYDISAPSSKKIVTDANGVMRVIYNQIKQEIR